MPDPTFTTITDNQCLILAFVHSANPYRDDEIRQFTYNARPQHEWASLQGIDKIIASLIKLDLIHRVTKSDRSPYIVTPKGLTHIKWIDQAEKPPEKSHAG